MKQKMDPKVVVLISSVATAAIAAMSSAVTLWQTRLFGVGFAEAVRVVPPLFFVFFTILLPLLLIMEIELVRFFDHR